MPTFGILVGGGPAPGINGVIAAATLMAHRRGARMLGFLDGFQGLMRGAPEVVELDPEAVGRIHLEGGSALRTSRANPTKDADDLKRVVEALGARGVDHLITVGGDDTAFSARRVAEEAGGRVRVVHVPKTIDNDLPLPRGIPTFGFETAREQATRIVANLVEDARTASRWYFVVVMGRKAGHLAEGAGKAAGATLTLIPEELPEGPVRLAHVVRTLEGAIAKRRARGRADGVAVLAEGLGERLEPADLEALADAPRDEHGHIRLAEVPLGSVLRDRVRESLRELGVKVTIVAKDVGYELRCAPPCAFDLDYTRDLGAGAVRTLLDGVSDVMVTRQDAGIVPVPFDEMQDASTGKTRVRLVDTQTASHASARALQERLEAGDLEPGAAAEGRARSLGLDPEALRARYGEAVERR